MFRFFYSSGRCFQRVEPVYLKNVDQEGKRMDKSCKQEGDCDLFNFQDIYWNWPQSSCL